MYYDHYYTFKSYNNFNTIDYSTYNVLQYNILEQFSLKKQNMISYHLYNVQTTTLFPKPVLYIIQNAMIIIFNLYLHIKDQIEKVIQYEKVDL